MVVLVGDVDGLGGATESWEWGKIRLRGVSYPFEGVLPCGANVQILVLRSDERANISTSVAKVPC